MQTIDITCRTDNVQRPEYQAIVDGVNLESTSLSKMECLITNVYPKVEFNYEFDRNQKYLRIMIQHEGQLMFFGSMEILETDYMQQITDILKRLGKRSVRIYDIHGDQIAEYTQDDLKAGKTLEL